MPPVAGEAAVCSIEHRESQQDYEKLAHTWIIRGFSLEGAKGKPAVADGPRPFPISGSGFVVATSRQ